MKWYKAQDTFVADLADGSEARVVKDQPLPENHELVKRNQDAGGALFKLWDTGEEDAPRSGPAARAAAKLTGKKEGG